MANEDRTPDLPQRVRGAARDGSASPGSPVLPAELRERIQAAVKAERGDAAANDQGNTAGTEHAPTSKGAGGDAASPTIHGANGAKKANEAQRVKAQRKRAAGSQRPARGEHLARSERTDEPGRAASSTPARPAITGPVPEDEVTQWIGRAAGPGATSAAPPRTAGQAPAQRRKGPWITTRLAILILALAVAVATLAIVVTFRHPAIHSATNRGATSAQVPAARNQAAGWVAQQVSPDAIVSCDPAMCAVLTAHGFPRHDLLVLGPASPVPVSSTVVVETAAVQSLFGSSLATAWAPKVLASFGSGTAGITVRVIAQHGAAAYEKALNADRAASQKSGTALLNDNQIVVSATARNQLAAGQVDSRLLLAIAALAGHQPISIVRFGNVGQGADATLPLRFADLAQNDPAARMSPSAYVQSARTYLNTVNTQFRPARTVTATLPSGRTVLRVEFTAPSLFGLFGP